jgi:hypothetical protein
VPEPREIKGNEQVLINQGELDSPSLFSLCSRFVALHRSLHDTAMTPTDGFQIFNFEHHNWDDDDKDWSLKATRPLLLAS